MTYRDDHEALRARLEAIEQRLRETESELAQARRLLDEQPSALEPSTAPPPSRRVGHPPPPPPGVSLARTLAGSSGAVLALFGIGFLLWNLPGADRLGDVGGILFVSALLFLGPGGLLVWLSLRQPARRHQPAIDAMALRRAAEALVQASRVEPPARVSSAGDASDDAGATEDVDAEELEESEGLEEPGQRRRLM